MGEQMKYAGSEWVERATKSQLSELGRQVADLLGDWQRGIYHIGRFVHQTDWKNTHWIEVILPDSDLATFDSDGLTRLVVLCHDRCIRMVVVAVTNRYIRLIFHPRKREGQMGERHPTMEQAIETIRKEYTQQ